MTSFSYSQEPKDTYQTRHLHSELYQLFPWCMHAHRLLYSCQMELGLVAAISKISFLLLLQWQNFATSISKRGFQACSCSTSTLISHSLKLVRHFAIRKQYKVHLKYTLTYIKEQKAVRNASLPLIKGVATKERCTFLCLTLRTKPCEQASKRKEYGFKTYILAFGFYKNQTKK